jgi:hypothetical protein
MIFEKNVKELLSSEGGRNFFPSQENEKANPETRF